MDDWRFDALTRAFARPASRRALAGVVATALAPLAAAAQPEPTACLQVGKRCSQKAAADASHGKGKGGKGKHHPPSCAKCCSRYGAAGPDGKARCTCKDEGIACDGDSQCCSGQCRTGTCTGCPPDQVFCPDGCANLQTDANHCGSCATACASGQRCAGGTCVCDGTSCPRGCCAQDGSCQRGTSDQACGIGGADCQTCQTCTTCDGTTCAAQSDICCGDTSVCRNGTCQDCGAGQVCHAGGCCTPDCAGKCGGVSNGCGGTCDTCETGQICAGTTCVAGQGTCATGDNGCAGVIFIPCNGKDTCVCFLSTEGETRCGAAANALGGCGDCGSSADCAQQYPDVPGVFCADTGTTVCCTGAAAPNACVAPCPST